MFKTMTGPKNYLTPGKFAFAALLAVVFCFANPASSSYAQKKKLATYGTIKIQTTPGGFPLAVDGKASGETTADYRDFDLGPGLHTIGISLPNGQHWTREIDVAAGRIKCLALNYRPVPPPVESPCPYPVNLSAPPTVSEGELITFTADVTYRGPSTLNYTWTLSPAETKILSGAGSRTITVDSTGLAGQRLVATLVVDDGSGDSYCRQTAQAATFIPPRARENPAREFDVCCSCSYDDQKARLDNLAVNLQSDPTASTYIIAYGGRSSRVGQADLLGARARDYLVTHRGINQSRIVVVNGGFRDQDCLEFWIVPSGATPPQPTPTVNPGDVHPAPEPSKRRRRSGV